MPEDFKDSETRDSETRDSETRDSVKVGGCNFGSDLGIDYTEALKRDEKAKKVLMKTGTIDLSRIGSFDLEEFVGKMLTRDAVIGTTTYGRIGQVLTLEDLMSWKKAGMRYLYIKYT
jgi:hypothetical protein